jgi:two-component system OmpR family response regulator
MVVILIAEDDPNVQLLLKSRLKAHYEVICAGDGREALEVVSSRHIDLLIADIMMPRMDGFELVQNLRRRSAETPVLMLTANQSFDAKRAGFRAGTDDYMTKPVNYEELQLRIQALLRRARVYIEEKVGLGGVVLDSSTYALSKAGISVELPKKEFDLLFKLCTSPGRIYTKNQLLDEIWGSESESGEETLKTHISRLRGRLKEIGGVEIIAVRGIGYKAEATGTGR